MKRVMIPVNGREYPLCFSLRVVNACADRFGGLDHLDTALTGGGNAMDALNNCVWLLGQMLDAGHRYSELNQLGYETPPGQDELLDLFGLDDLAGLKACLTAGMAADQTRSVEAVPGKNAGAAGAEESA